MLILSISFEYHPKTKISIVCKKNVPAFLSNSEILFECYYHTTSKRYYYNIPKNTKTLIKKPEYLTQNRGSQSTY